MKKSLLILIATLSLLCLAFGAAQAATTTLNACVPVIGATGYTVDNSVSGACLITLNNAWPAADDLAISGLENGTVVQILTTFDSAATPDNDIAIGGISYANGNLQLSPVDGTTLTINGPVSAVGGNLIIEDNAGAIVIDHGASAGNLITVSANGLVSLKSAAMTLKRNSASDLFATRDGTNVPLILSERMLKETATDANTLSIAPLLMPNLTLQSAKCGEAKDYDLSTYFFDPDLQPVSIGGYKQNGSSLRQSPLYESGLYDVVVNFMPHIGITIYGATGQAITNWTFSSVWQITQDTQIGGIDFYPIFQGNEEPGCGFGRECRRMPCTGFPAGLYTALREQPTELAYQDLKLSLEIPTLAVSTELVGVPEESESWAVEWLQDRAGLLAGSALPGEGYSFIAAHNHLNNQENGPFLALGNLSESDLVFIRKADGSLQKFEIYANEMMEPDDIDKLSAIAMQEENSMVLITCENQASDGTYLNRRVVFAKPL